MSRGSASPRASPASASATRVGEQPERHAPHPRWRAARRAGWPSMTSVGGLAPCMIVSSPSSSTPSQLSATPDAALRARAHARAPASPSSSALGSKTPTAAVGSSSSAAASTAATPDALSSAPADLAANHARHHRHAHRASAPLLPATRAYGSGRARVAAPPRRAQQQQRRREQHHARDANERGHGLGLAVEVRHQPDPRRLSGARRNRRSRSRREAADAQYRITEHARAKASQCRAVRPPARSVRSDAACRVTAPNHAAASTVAAPSAPPIGVP